MFKLSQTRNWNEERESLSIQEGYPIQVIFPELDLKNHRNIENPSRKLFTEVLKVVFVFRPK